jgi:hypothetical protein
MWEDVVVQVLCILLALGSLAAAAWTVLTGQIGEQGLDAVFLVVVCLVAALTFSLIPLRAVRQGTWKNLLGRAPGRAAEPEHKRRANV